MATSYVSPYVAARGLARQLSESWWWGGGCSDVRLWGGQEGRNGPAWNSGPLHRHQYCSTFYFVGPEKTMMVETGHHAHWPLVEEQLERVLGGRDLDYVFPSQQEQPHSGNLGKVMAKYPSCVAVGNLKDYHLYFPGIDRKRLAGSNCGDTLDLGDRTFEFLEPVWQCHASTQWGADLKERVLFPVDGFEYMHLADWCGLVSEEFELPPADVRASLITVIQPGRADIPMQLAFGALKALWSHVDPVLVCPTHAAPLRGNLPEVVPWIMEQYATAGSDRDWIGDAGSDWARFLAVRSPDA
jgi:flavorubredoxin